MTTEPRLTLLTEEQILNSFPAQPGDWPYRVVAAAQLAADQKVLDYWIKHLEKAEDIIESLAGD